ncbi:MAG: hypothetical protein WA667_16950 [Candidatus Nitrosopolaris sp.]
MGKGGEGGLQPKISCATAVVNDTVCRSGACGVESLPALGLITSRLTPAES